MEMHTGHTLVKVMKAGDLPESLRSGIAADADVLVSVDRLTENGFTEAFEQEVLEAERQVADVPFRDAAVVLAELQSMIDEE